jgi:hypothetical protein
MKLTAFALDVVRCLNESFQQNVNKEVSNCENIGSALEITALLALILPKFCSYCL